jgi:transcriptional regulator with XRE-family HTH domain
MNTYVSFGQRLQIVRKDLGLTQKQVSEAIRMHKSEVSAYERGRQMPTFWSLCELARALNVSIDWLAGLSDERRAPPVEGGAVNRESLDLLLRADRALVYFQLGTGCAILALLVVGRLKGLL